MINKHLPSSILSDIERKMVKRKHDFIDAIIKREMAEDLNGRTTIINNDEIVDLKIALNTLTINEFLLAIATKICKICGNEIIKNICQCEKK